MGSTVRVIDPSPLEIQPPMNSNSGASKMEVVAVLGILLIWFALQAWILPRFGVST